VSATVGAAPEVSVWSLSIGAFVAASQSNNLPRVGAGLRSPPPPFPNLARWGDPPIQQQAEREI